MSTPQTGKPRVGLFVTCLVDVVRPSIAFAAARLIDDAGCAVEVPALQTCCGQPSYNAGAEKDARRIARATIGAFEGVDYVVAPSGSCAAMLRMHYPRLLAGGPDEAEARAFAERVHELTSFLVDVRKVTSVRGAFRGRVAYHDACSGLRELGIRAAPRRLLSMVPGLEVLELADREACCGFGGTFSVKFPEISTALVDRKCAAIAAAGADVVLSGDLGCLMNLAGRLSRQGSAIGCRHVAEVLAGELHDPPIACAATTDATLPAAASAESAPTAGRARR